MKTLRHFLAYLGGESKLEGVSRILNLTLKISTLFIVTIGVISFELYGGVEQILGDIVFFMLVIIIPFFLYSILSIFDSVTFLVVFRFLLALVVLTSLRFFYSWLLFLLIINWVADPSNVHFEPAVAAIGVAIVLVQFLLQSSAADADNIESNLFKKGVSFSTRRRGADQDA